MSALLQLLQIYELSRLGSDIKNFSHDLERQILEHVLIGDEDEVSLQLRLLKYMEYSKPSDCVMLYNTFTSEKSTFLTYIVACFTSVAVVLQFDVGVIAALE